MTFVQRTNDYSPNSVFYNIKTDTVDIFNHEGQLKSYKQIFYTQLIISFLINVCLSFHTDIWYTSLSRVHCYRLLERLLHSETDIQNANRLLESVLHFVAENQDANRLLGTAVHSGAQIPRDVKYGFPL
jgi:hypothetical protein